MQSKRLASTLKKFTVFLITLSIFMLCGCGDDSQTSVSSDEATTVEATSEQTELQNQDKDPTEATTQQTTQGTTQSTQETTTAPTTQTQTTESTNPGHVHTWTTETYYTTETQVVHHDAVTHTVHHDAVTHQETVTTYTTETTTVHHDGSYRCCGCGATFSSESAVISHCESNIDCLAAGYVGTPGYDEQVQTQVPHTETVTVVDSEAWDETVVDTPAWDETVEVQVPHTRTVCSECGATK